MALVNCTNITLKESSSTFNAPFEFEITLQCIGQLDEDLNWRVVYVGSVEGGGVALSSFWR
jgi:histone chaperone ASF1